MCNINVYDLIISSLFVLSLAFAFYRTYYSDAFLVDTLTRRYVRYFLVRVSLLEEYNYYIVVSLLEEYHYYIVVSLL